MNRTAAPRIDSHQHFWRISRGDYGWLTEDIAPLYRDFGPDDLRALLADARVERTIVVQAAPTVAETEFLLELAENTDFVVGVVGWIDMNAGDAPETLERLAANPYFKGIRPMIQDIDDPEWMLRPELSEALEALIALNLSFDALVLPQHLHNLLILLKRHPGLRAVIDHGAKPPIADSIIGPWQQDMSALAAETSAFCKLSGLVTQAGNRSSLAELQPYVDALVESFSPDRLMWGSDWPVLVLADSYRDWAARAEILLRHRSARDREKIFGQTARSFYRID